MHVSIVFYINDGIIVNLCLGDLYLLYVSHVVCSYVHYLC